MHRISVTLCGLIVFLFCQSATAGGYDTPILYTARHMGMGGTAIGYVNDPSAMFHNPAGLGHTDWFSFIGNFSPILGMIQASPARADQNATSETAFAPFFLVGGAYRVTDYLTLGVGAYPVASSGAVFIHDDAAGREMEDETRLVFIEIVPGFSINLPFGLKVGVAYRATLVDFDRRQQVSALDNPTIDISLSGQNFAGFRAGIQWQPIPWVQVGFVYRHKTETEVTADSSVIIGTTWGETSLLFVLPTKIGLGVRADLGPFGAAVDVEYGFNSENAESAIVAQNANNPEANPLSLPSQFRWDDSITLRGGFEFTFLPMLSGRIGYVFDDKVSNPQYPSAFGTPPTATHTLTTGLGASLLGYLQVNLAYAYRFGSVTITAEDIAGGEHTCRTCSHPGDYQINMHGMYIDASIAF